MRAQQDESRHHVEFFPGKVKLKFGHGWFWLKEREKTFTTAVTGSAEGGQHEAPRDRFSEVRRFEAPGCGALRCQGL